MSEVYKVVLYTSDPEEVKRRVEDIADIVEAWDWLRWLGELVFWAVVLSITIIGLDIITNE